MISLRNIVKKYKNFKALNEFDLIIKEGQIHALIGPNGSGKTTVVGVILSLLHYTGERKIKIPLDRIGVSLENEVFFENLSVFDNLKFVVIQKKSSYIELNEIINKLGLKEIINQKVKTLSKGNRKKVSIASALIGNPDFYIFDEPLTGLDFNNLILFRDLIVNLKEQGKTVLINSHILSEMEKICTNITFVSSGKNYGTYMINDIQFSFGNIENAYKKILKKK